MGRRGKPFSIINIAFDTILYEEKTGTSLSYNESLSHTFVVSNFIHICHRHTLSGHCMTISSSGSLLTLSAMSCWIACNELKFNQGML